MADINKRNINNKNINNKNINNIDKNANDINNGLNNKPESSDDSDERSRKLCLHRSLVYIPITLFLLLFGYIYELNGHGVYSFYMIYAFLPSLIGGVVFWMIAGMCTLHNNTKSWFINFWTALIITLTLGMIFKGVLDIYGTSSRLCNIYWILSGVLLILSTMSFAIKK